MSGANTTRPNKHLLEKHRISSEKRVQIEDEESQTTQAAPIVRSVLQQQIDGSEQRPTQLTIDRILLAFVQWIILAHIALSCVELKPFQDLLKLLNPVVFGYIYTTGKSIRSFILKEY